MRQKAELIRQVRLTKANASEPLQTCRKRRDAIKTGLQSLVREEVREKPTDCPSGGRHQRRREREQQALVRNVGTCTLGGKGEIQVADP